MIDTCTTNPVTRTGWQAEHSLVSYLGNVDTVYLVEDFLGCAHELGSTVVVVHSISYSHIIDTTIRKVELIERASTILSSKANRVFGEDPIGNLLGRVRGTGVIRMDNDDRNGLVAHSIDIFQSSRLLMGRFDGL